MAVGTSLGQLFDDDFHYYQNQHDPDKFPSTGELKPADTGDNNTLTPKGLEGNKNQATDPDLVTPISDRLLVTRDNPPNPSYDTQLTPEQKTTYDSRYGGDSNRDYDMQGYFKANPDVMPNAEGQHYPDTYKKPNHPTFSDESIYHGVDGNQGGHWGQEDGKDTFTPGPTNMQNWGKQGLQDYFQRVEPDVKLKDALPDFTNDRPHDWVERTAIAAGKAFQLPGDVLSGKVQPGSQEEIERAADLAGLIAGSPAATGEKASLGAGGKYDAYIKMFTDKASTLDNKLSAKEAYMQGVQETHAHMMDQFSNIRNQYFQDAKGEGLGNYTEKAYRGIYGADENFKLNPDHFKNKEGGYGELYTTSNPDLADMYAGGLSKHPGREVQPGVFPQGAQVMPLVINTKNYHYFDAKGKSWQEANHIAMDEARNLKKHGVIVDNVYDEPGSTRALPPSKIYITFPSGAATVKSRFATKFDPKDPNMMHMIPAIGIGGAAGYIAKDDLSQQE